MAESSKHGRDHKEHCEEGESSKSNEHHGLEADTRRQTCEHLDCLEGEGTQKHKNCDVNEKSVAKEIGEQGTKVTKAITDKQINMVTSSNSGTGEITRPQKVCEAQKIPVHSQKPKDNQGVSKENWKTVGRKNNGASVDPNPNKLSANLRKHENAFSKKSDSQVITSKGNTCESRQASSSKHTSFESSQREGDPKITRTNAQGNSQQMSQTSKQMETNSTRKENDVTTLMQANGRNSQRIVFASDDDEDCVSKNDLSFHSDPDIDDVFCSFNKPARSEDGRDFRVQAKKEFILKIQQQKKALNKEQGTKESVATAETSKSTSSKVNKVTSKRDDSVVVSHNLC